MDGDEYREILEENLLAAATATTATAFQQENYRPPQCSKLN